MATIDQLRQAVVQAHRDGDTQAAELFARKIKEGDYEGQSGAVASALQGLGAGATLGTADEIAAAIRAGAERYVNPAMYAIARKFAPYEGQEDRTLTELYREHQEQFYGDPIGERYSQALESQREALETAREEDPWTTGIAEFTGGLGTAGVGLGKAAAQATLRAAIPRVAAGGAAVGGVGGYGYSEADPLSALVFGEPDEWKKELTEAGGDVAVGTGLGATLGAASPLAGAGVRAIARTVTNPFTKNARITQEAKDKILAAVQEDIDMGYINSMDDLARQMRESGLSVADAGPMTRQLTEKIAQTPTAGGRAVENFLTTRNKEQYRRLFPKLAEAIGAEDNFSGARRQLIRNMTEQANALYDRAYSVPMRMTLPMKAIVSNPEFARALRTANRIRRGKGLNPLPKNIEADAPISMEELDQILQGMDDVVSKDFKNAPAVARNITKPLRDSFRDMLYQANPAFREARTAWSGEKLNDEAMDKGLRIFTQDADITGDLIRDMGPSERGFFKIGALRAIARKLGNKSDTSDLTKGIFDSPNKREAVRIAFGNRQNFDDFMRYIEGEQRKFETFKQAVGNSATAKRVLQQTGDPGGILAGALGLGTTGSLLVAGAARRLYQAVRPSARRAQRAEDVINLQAPMLTSADPAMLQQLQRGTSLGGLLATGGQPSVGVGLGGLLSTSVPGAIE